MSSNLTNTIKENITILDYCNENNIPYRKAGRYYQLIEMDSLMVKPDGKYFTRYSTDERGSVIDFVMLYDSLDKTEAITKLRYMLPNFSHGTEKEYKPPTTKKVETERNIQFPKPYNGKYTRLFSYLINVRNISPTVIKDLISRKLMYEEGEHHNIVWTGYDYDGKAKFGCRRVTVDKEHLPKFSLKKENQQKTGVFLSEDKEHLFLINRNCDDEVVQDLFIKNNINSVYVSDEKFVTPTLLSQTAEVYITDEIELPNERYIVQEPFTRGDITGSDKKIGWFVNNNSNSLLACEAPIDAMSLMTLLEYHNVSPKRYSYLAQSGVCTKSLEYHLSKNPKIDTVYLCYDNDEAGHKARGQTRELLKSLGFDGRIIDKPPHSKDWNEDLQGINITFEKKKQDIVIEQQNMFKKEKKQQWYY